MKLGPDGTAMRNFQNFHYAAIREQDFSGARAIVDNGYKLVIDGGPDTGKELFDLRARRASFAGKKFQIIF